MAIIRSISPKTKTEKIHWRDSLLMQDLLGRDKERSKKVIDKYNKSIKKQKAS